MAELRWWRQRTPIGTIGVVAGDAGVRALSFDASTLDEALLGAAVPERDGEVAREIDEWWAGTRRSFGVRADLDGCGVTGFARRVYDTLVREVGWGEVVTYGELAALAGSPGGARAVGQVMAANPVPLLVPCHRVVAAGGRLGGYGGSRPGSVGSERELARKRALLAHEGVTGLR